VGGVDLNEVIMRIAPALLWTAMATLSGCGLFSSDPCAKADEAVQTLADKSASCSGSGLTLPQIKGKSVCDTAVKNCSETEKTILSEELDCIINLSACVAGNEKDFAISAGACLFTTSQLSDSCKKGFGF
jgi:hypothetical protein